MDIFFYFSKVVLDDFHLSIWVCFGEETMLFAALENAWCIAAICEGQDTFSVHFIVF